VPSYLVETFLPRGAATERTAREARARAAAAELTRQGTRVSFERTIHLPEDEMCFFLFVASSGREAALVAEHAALDPFRVVEAFSSEVASSQRRGPFKPAFASASGDASKDNICKEER
jgi:hypothetical protein